MQYRRPVGAGPSLKTWPRWALHLLQTTSVLTIPMLMSVLYCMASLFAGCQKLGHPVPELNFESDSKRGASQQTQKYLPGSLLLQYMPVKGISVPLFMQTRYCSSVSRSLSSSRVGIFSTVHMGNYAIIQRYLLSVCARRFSDFISAPIRPMSYPFMLTNLMIPDSMGCRCLIWLYISCATCL